MSKSRVMKGYSVSIAEEKFTIPVTPEPEPEIIADGNEDETDGLEYGEDETEAGAERGYGEYDKYKSANAKEQPESEADKTRKSVEEELARAKELREREYSEYEQKIRDYDANIMSRIDRIEELEAQIRELETTSHLIGEEIIVQSQRTADLIVNHTLDTAKTEMNAAMSQGYADGFETGRSEAASVISPALAKIAALTDAVEQAQDKMLEDFKDEMFDIIDEISKKILHREIDEKDEYLITLFSDAVKEIKAENFVTVTVSEAQAEFAVRNIDLFKSKVANIEDFKILPDKNAHKGTMIVETTKTVADASFSVQMGTIDSILERMRVSFSSSPILPEEENRENEENADNASEPDFSDLTGLTGENENEVDIISEFGGFDETSENGGGII